MSKAHPEKWTVLLDHRAEKIIKRLDKTTRKRVDKAIRELAHNPYPPNSRKLVGYEHHHRLRVGSWRIIYTIRKQQLVILIVKVAPRGQVYKR